LNKNIIWLFGLVSFLVVKDFLHTLQASSKNTHSKQIILDSK